VLFLKIILKKPSISGIFFLDDGFIISMSHGSICRPRSDFVRVFVLGVPCKCRVFDLGAPCEPRVFVLGAPCEPWCLDALLLCDVHHFF
jgi:hypothetical protein